MNMPFTPEPVVASRPYRVSAADYLRMIDVGLFADAHVELVDGVLLQLAPSHTAHARLLIEMGRLLGNVYAGSDVVVYGDVITRFAGDTVRAPDIGVVDRDIGERKMLEPADILLAVEVSDATIAEDLGCKRIDYATAGIRHYWVVDVDGGRVHCYADPQGSDYAAIQVVRFGQPLAVLGSDAAIAVA